MNGDATMKDDSQVLLMTTFQSLFCRLDQFTLRMEAPSPSSTPSSSSPDDESEDDAIITLVHNSTQTLGVLKKAMVDMSWMDLMTKDDMEERRKRLNVFKTVLRELSKCCTDVQVGLKSAHNGAIGKEITSSFCFHIFKIDLFLFMFLSVCLSICLPVCLCLSVGLSVCLSICRSVCLTDSTKTESWANVQKSVTCNCR